MTHHNIFQEIDEDLERQKWEELWKRHGPLIITFAIGIVLATALLNGWHSYRASQEQKASSALAGILSDQKINEEKKIEELQDFAQKNKGETQATFAQLHAADLAAKAGDKAKAVSIYDAVAGNSQTDPAFRQLADLMAVETGMDSGDPVVLQKRLQPLLADNAPWRYTAMEYDAFLALRAGDKAKAKQLFAELSQDAGAPQTLAARAADMLRYLGE